MITAYESAVNMAYNWAVYLVICKNKKIQDLKKKRMHDNIFLPNKYPICLLFNVSMEDSLLILNCLLSCRGYLGNNRSLNLLLVERGDSMKWCFGWKNLSQRVWCYRDQKRPKGQNYPETGWAKYSQRNVKQQTAKWKCIVRHHGL